MWTLYTSVTVLHTHYIYNSFQS